MYLYLVRHGESEGNTSGVFHGQKDFPLTDKGREQARESGRKLKEKHFTRCCASDLKRAWETAQLCLEGRDIEPEACPDLREHDVGSLLEGTPWPQLRESDPELAQGYIHDWFHTYVPGGESPEAMIERVSRCVDAIIERGEDTLIAAHNVCLNVILYHLGLREEAIAIQGRTASFFEQGCYTAIEIVDGKAKLLGFNL